MTAFAGELTRRIKRVTWSQLLMPRLEDILFIAILFAVIALGPRLMNMDGDLGRHLTIGNYILESGSIPTRDIFSHTMEGLPLTPHEWLAQVLFALSYRLGGLNGVVIFCALLIAVTFTLVFRQSLRQSKLLLLSLGMTILAAAAASIHWLARPHLFTMLFTVLWIGELERWRTTGRRRWWLLPLLMLIWVNSHGAFIVGILIWLIYLIDHLYSKLVRISSKDSQSSRTGRSENHELQTRVFIIAGIAVFLVTVLNPAGLHIWETTFGFLQNRYLISHTVEYQPPDFQQINAWPFLLMICISILLLSIRRSKVSLTEALLLTCWTAFGLISARNIAIYAIVAAPLLARIGASILQGSDNSKRFVNFDQKLAIVDHNLVGYLWPVISIIIIGGLLISGARLDYSGLGNKFSRNVFPVEAVDWILENPGQGQVFNYFPWGGYLLFRTWPQQQVFIDGQTDFYGEDLTRQYEKVITLGEGWQEILVKFEVEWVIMPADSDLSQILDDNQAWKRQYTDQTASVYFRVP